MNNFMSSLVLYTLLMNLSNSQDQKNTATICYNSTLEGFRLNTTVWQTKGVVEKIDCIMECATKPCCRSINYKKTEDKSNCEMLHYVVSEKPKKLVENTSYDHIHLVNPKKDFNTICESGEDDCKFTAGSFCHWVPNQTQGYRWKTVPRKDDTLDSDYYVFAETDNTTELHAKAVLRSKEFRTSECRCISWKYRLEGQEAGNLKLYVKDKQGYRRMIWTLKDGLQRNKWISASATIANVSQTSYWIEFETKHHSSSFSKVALDNIFFEENPCVLQRVGCFKDNTNNRVIPTYIGSFREQIDWYNIDKTVRQCSCAAHEGGYKVFAVQYYGECWGSREMVQYDKYGASKDCWELEGVGEIHTNFVYKFA